MLNLHTILAVVLIGSCACLMAGILAVRWSTVDRARHQRELLARAQGRGDRP